MVKDALLERRWGMELVRVADWEALLSHEVSAAPWGPCAVLGWDHPREGCAAGAGAYAVTGIF